MSWTEIYNILSERAKIAESKSGGRIIFTGLFGSQNYGLDDSSSDVDCVCVVLPTLNNLIDSAPISKEIMTDNGKINLVDIRNFAKQIESGSFVNLEALFSIYAMVDDSFEDFYLRRYAIYAYLYPKFRKAIYCATRSIIRKIDSATEEKKDKLSYEALRLGYLYRKITETPEPLNFYIDDLCIRSKIGLIKCGCTSAKSEIGELIAYLDANPCDDKKFDGSYGVYKNPKDLAKEIILSNINSKNL